MNRLFGLVLIALALVGCAQTGERPPTQTHATAPLRLQAPVVLLGEVHDNAAGHRLRLAAFDALLADGARPALLLEPFERGDQPAIDAARARQPAPTAAELVDAVLAARPGGAGRTRSGWHWPFYEPFIARALQQGLPEHAFAAAIASRNRFLPLISFLSPRPRMWFAAAGSSASTSAGVPSNLL